MPKILVLLAEGFEEIEALLPVDFWRRLGFEVHTASINNQPEIKGAHGITVKADRKLVEMDEEYDALFLPGGMPGSANLRDDKSVITLIQRFHNTKKLVSAICAAPIALDKAGILKSKKHTAHPSVKDTFICSTYTGTRVERDENIITGKGPGAAAEFAREVARYLGAVYEAYKLYSDMLFS
jgi:4-methyl-5(b-hydroxyethyl)-thiazole monophosphate biosynthesis